MCFRRIGRKFKNMFVWITERGYKFTVGLLVILWMIGVIINPPITVFLTWIWGMIIGSITYSWRKARDTTQWTLGTAWQQVKHWREGRRRYSETRRKEKYGN